MTSIKKQRQSIKKQRQSIQRAFTDCMRLAAKYGAAHLLTESYLAAEREERRHRRGTGGRWVMPVRACAQYFAVKWFLDTTATRAPRDWSDPCELREDCRYAYAAMSRVLRVTPPQPYARTTEVDQLRLEHAAVLELDYTSWVSR